MSQVSSSYSASAYEPFSSIVFCSNSPMASFSAMSTVNSPSQFTAATSAPFSRRYLKLKKTVSENSTEEQKIGGSVIQLIYLSARGLACLVALNISTKLCLVLFVIPLQENTNDGLTTPSPELTTNSYELTGSRQKEVASTVRWVQISWLPAF